MITKTFVQTVILCMGFSIQLFSQEYGNIIYNSNSYKEYTNAKNTTSGIINDSICELEVKILYNATADSYIAMFGLSQFGETLDISNSLMNHRINGFIDSLTRIGIPKNDIFIDIISQVPIYEYEVEKKIFSRTFNEVPKGFSLSKNIHIALKNNNKLNRIMEIAAKFEIYDFIKMDYIINNYEAIYDTLRSTSIKLMNKKKDDFKKLGFSFASKYQVIGESYYSSYPAERYNSYTAFNSSNVYISKKIFSSTQVNNTQKQTTYYYNKLPNTNFDIVLNPEILQPVVQLVYSLKIRYTMKKS